MQVRRQGTTAFYSLVDEHARKLVTEAVFQAQNGYSIGTPAAAHDVPTS